MMEHSGNCKRDGEEYIVIGSCQCLIELDLVNPQILWKGKVVLRKHLLTGIQLFPQ